GEDLVRPDLEDREVTPRVVLVSLREREREPADPLLDCCSAHQSIVTLWGSEGGWAYCFKLVPTFRRAALTALPFTLTHFLRFGAARLRIHASYVESWQRQTPA